MLPSELLNSNDFNSAILESIQDGIIVIDEKQIVRYVNIGAEMMFSRAKADMEGRPLVKLIPKRHRTRHPAKVKQFFSSDRRVRDMSDRPALSGVRGTGEEFSVAISIAKMHWNEQTWAIAVIRDVSATAGNAAIASLRQEYEQFSGQVAMLIEEIKRLRTQDEQTGNRISQIEARIDKLVASEDGGALSIQGWIQRLSLWQRILAALAGAVLLISQGVSITQVVDQTLQQVEDIELPD